MDCRFFEYVRIKTNQPNATTLSVQREGPKRATELGADAYFRLPELREFREARVVIREVLQQWVSQHRAQPKSSSPYKGPQIYSRFMLRPAVPRAFLTAESALQSPIHTAWPDRHKRRLSPSEPIPAAKGRVHDPHHHSTDHPCERDEGRLRGVFRRLPS